VRTTIRTGGRFRPVEFPDTDVTSFVDPLMPGRGLCEICHRTTRFYPASGHGESHFTDECTVCHDHAAGFRPGVSYANCSICHAAETARLAKPNLHHTEFGDRCSACHPDAGRDPGPGHRATAACSDCHSTARVATHAPGIAIPCSQCHEPHGTDNIRLVRDVIHTVQGTDQPVRFDNLDGVADGSFASVSAPGTGLCETCHTRTQFYRADGRGAPHFALPCIQCHSHAAGFSPQ
jgi:hypothetical protein